MTYSSYLPFYYCACVCAGAGALTLLNTIISLLSLLFYCIPVKLKFKWILNTHYKAYAFITLPLESSKNFVSIIIAGLIVTIPSSYLSIVKNFGLGFFLGIPSLALGNIVVYTMTGEVLLDDLNGQLLETLREMDRLFSQLSTFINQFHNFVNQTGINVITDAQGELGIDVVDTLDDSIAQQYANRINILDSLIHNHIHSIENTLERASGLEARINELDSNYTSRLPEYTNRLSQLVRSYGH